MIGQMVGAPGKEQGVAVVLGVKGEQHCCRPQHTGIDGSTGVTGQSRSDSSRIEHQPASASRRSSAMVAR